MNCCVGSRMDRGWRSLRWVVGRAARSQVEADMMCPIRADCGHNLSDVRCEPLPEVGWSTTTSNKQATLEELLLASSLGIICWLKER